MLWFWWDRLGEAMRCDAHIGYVVLGYVMRGQARLGYVWAMLCYVRSDQWYVYVIADSAS